MQITIKLCNLFDLIEDIDKREGYKYLVGT